VSVPRDCSLNWVQHFSGDAIPARVLIVPPPKYPGVDAADSHYLYQLTVAAKKANISLVGTDKKPTTIAKLLAQVKDCVPENIEKEPPTAVMMLVPAFELRARVQEFHKSKSSRMKPFYPPVTSIIIHTNKTAVDAYSF